jgi:ribosome biogenesis GTPase A
MKAKRSKRSSFILGKHKGKLKSFSQNRHKDKFANIVKKVITDSHIILEILDSRFIDETRNKDIEHDIQSRHKKLIFVFNKSDLVNIHELKAKIKRRGIKRYVIMSTKQRKGGQELRNKLKIEASRIKDENKTEGRVQVGIIGYPNSGKSSVINLLVGRPVAKTAFEAGFTKGLQKIKIAEGLFIFDTPGVVPREETLGEEGYVKHASIGARNYDKIREPEFVVGHIMLRYPGALEKFYSIEVLNDVDAMIEQIGKKKGFLKKGGEVDVDRTSRMILKDWQEGKIEAHEE